MSKCTQSAPSTVVFPQSEVDPGNYLGGAVSGPDKTDEIRPFFGTDFTWTNIKKPGIPRFMNGSDGMDSVNHANQRASIAFFTTLASLRPRLHHRRTQGNPCRKGNGGFIQETLAQQMHVKRRTYILE